MAGMIERGNVMDPELAIFLLSELDGMIQSDIMLLGPEEIVSYENQEQELILRKPHDGIYVSFLVAMIRQVQEEFEGYNNAQGIVNEKLETFREWYVAHYDPAETASREYMGAAPGGAGYGFAYLTAYGLAVKHGYSGTEEEWLRSLEGQPGAAGEAARMRFDAERGVIQWGVGEQWYDLFTLEELKDPVVEELMQEVRTLAERASRDKEAANQAANTAAGHATAAGGHAKTAADAAAEALTLAGRAYTSEQAAVTAAGDAQVQAETAEGYAIRAEGAAVGAEASAEIALGAARDVSAAIVQHDSSTQAHSDLRLELQALRERVTTLLDSDDTTLDQLSEIVGYIKSNRTLIEAVTTGKVSVSDIVNDLVTNVPGKPLSAAMGVELAAQIGALAARVAVTAADVGSLAVVRADGSLGPVVVGDSLELKDGRLNVTGGGSGGGEPGNDGITPHIGDNGNWWLGDRDTGVKAQGPQGEPGYTPVKFVDYFLPEEIEEVARQAAEMVDVPEGGGGGGSPDWTLIGEITADGTGNNAGVALPVNFGEWLELFITVKTVANTKVTPRLMLSRLMAWYDGQTLVIPAHGGQSYLYQCVIKRIGGKIYPFAGYTSGYTSGDKALTPIASPRAAFLPTDFNYIRVDTNDNAEFQAVEAGTELKVWGYK